MSISNKAKEDGCREPACSEGESVQDDEAGESGDLPVLLPGGDSDCGFLKKCLLVVGGLLDQVQDRDCVRTRPG